jgi:hypothetical protein
MRRFYDKRNKQDVVFGSLQFLRNRFQDARKYLGVTKLQRMYLACAVGLDIGVVQGNDVSV